MRGLIVLVICCGWLTGCSPAGAGPGTGSGSDSCKAVGFGFIVSPSSSANTAPDHSVGPPGNQEQFIAGKGSLYGPGCASNALLASVHAQWTTSDAANVIISSANDATNGLATCLGTTNSTVTATLTADGFTETSTAPLVCK